MSPLSFFRILKVILQRSKFILFDYRNSLICSNALLINVELECACDVWFNRSACSWWFWKSDNVIFLMYYGEFSSFIKLVNIQLIIIGWSLLYGFCCYCWNCSCVVMRGYFFLCIFFWFSHLCFNFGTSWSSVLILIQSDSSFEWL